MFLDTSGLLCYYDVADNRNADAVALFDAAPRLLTHNYVLAEIIPLAHARKLHRRGVMGFCNDLLSNSTVEVVWVDPLVHGLAMDLLGSRSDKTYSLCDAVSFLLMRERGVIEALTTDRHFEQEGFIRLLKP